MSLTQLYYIIHIYSSLVSTQLWNSDEEVGVEIDSF